MHPAIKLLVAGAVIAIVIVIFQSQRQEDEQSGWIQYGTAEAQSLDVAALEAARDQTHGTSAEPWVAYQLALKLWEAGGRTNLDRSRQIAQEALDRFPDHPAAARFRRLVEVVESYAGVPDKA